MKLGKELCWSDVRDHDVQGAPIVCLLDGVVWSSIWAGLNSLYSSKGISSLLR